MLHIHFPLILDDYIMREFGSTFALVLATFSLVFVIFTFFELIGDIIRNRIAFVTVGEYLLNLIPYILYNVTPLCVLVAVLITFGSLAKTSELTAMKASGLSLYRVVTPVLVLTAIIAAALFAFDESYLPAANRRQEALRSVIKGKPAQTFLSPGPSMDLRPNPPHPGPPSLNPIPPPATPNPARIFFYQFSRSRQERLRQPHRLRDRSRHLQARPSHLRLLCPLGPRGLPVDSRKRLVSQLLRRGRRLLHPLYPLHLPRAPRAP